MNSRVQQQIQPGELHSVEQVQAEIDSFLQAVDSYPDRAAKEPNLSFHQYIRSFFVKAGNTRKNSSPNL